MNDLSEKLRAEILDSKQKRHDIVMRKFAMISVFLGAGSLGGKSIGGLVIDLAPLLYLVPLVAIAFDFYNFTEDYRIKRAGEFLRRCASATSAEEKSWELFAKQNPNHMSTMAYGLVTLIYLLGAALVLNQSYPNKTVYWLWIVLVVLIEVSLVSLGVRIRRSLEKTTLEKSD